MTNIEKRELKQLCREGYNFKEIKEIVDCCDSTISQYMKIFSPKKENK